MSRVRVVVDTSLAGGLNRAARERIREEAKDLFERGTKTGDQDMVARAQQLLSEIAEAEKTGAAVSEVPFTAEEETARDTDEAEAAAQAEAEATVAATERQIRGAVAERLAALAAAADKIAAGNATAPEQRDALALCLRTTVQLARLQLRQLEAAD